jgi:hypothetical protein
METDGIRRIVDGIRAVLAGRIFVGEAVDADGSLDMG